MNFCKGIDLLLPPVPFSFSNILFFSSLLLISRSPLISFFPCFLHGFEFILYITLSKFGHIGLWDRFRRRKQNLCEDREKAKTRERWQKQMKRNCMEYQTECETFEETGNKLEPELNLQCLFLKRKTDSFFCTGIGISHEVVFVLNLNLKLPITDGSQPCLEILVIKKNNTIAN